MSNYIIREESRTLSPIPNTISDKTIRDTDPLDSSTPLENLIFAIDLSIDIPCDKFKCDNKLICTVNATECKSFRYFVNNNRYSPKREKDIKRCIRPIE